MKEDSGFKQAKYFEHVDRRANAALGVRVVEFLRLAYSKDAPKGWGEIAVYRPLDTNAFVYKSEGGWDFRPLSEFSERYRPITDEMRIAELDKLSQEIYDPAYWAEFRMRAFQEAQT